MILRVLSATAVAAFATVAHADHAPEQAKDALMQGHHKMMADMEQVEPTGDADRDFVLMMIPHHQGAIDAANVELQFGHDEQFRAMAEEIIAAQEREIAQLKAWLEAEGQ